MARHIPAILKLLSSEDKPLLVWGDSLLVLDLGLDVFDGVRGLHLKGDGLARQGLHENLHSASGNEYHLKLERLCLQNSIKSNL